MVKITGALKVRGTIDGITCCKTKDGYILRKKSEAKAKPKDRTKENMQEFAHAISGASIIRNTFAAIINEIDVPYFGHRLNNLMTKVVKSDSINPRGRRNLSDGDIELLKGFQFNADKRLSDVLKGPFSASIDRSSGLMKISFPSLTNTSLIKNPEEASHFRLSITGASINFTTADRLVVQKAGEYLPIGNEGHILSSMEVQLPAASTSALILVLGICFYKEENGKFTSVGKGHNAAVFVAVSGS